MIALIFSAIFFLSIIVYTIKYIQLKNNYSLTKEEFDRRIYEISILKEIGDRTGYSLNIDEILQIITGSLRQFIDYTAVGYAVVLSDKMKINIHLEESVNDLFISDMKKRMLDSISALANKNFDDKHIEDILSGALINKDSNLNIGSFFNIPIVISGAVAGVLIVTHTKSGLYKEKDMTLLYKITKQASEAVEKLEEFIKAEESRLNSMVLSMRDGVLMVDSNYRVVVSNPVVNNLIGKELLDNITIFDLIDKISLKFDIRGKLEEAITKGENFISEKIQIKNIFFEIGVYPVFNNLSKDTKSIIGGVIIFHDVSRDVELEKVREEFTHMIVHELRSPIDGIKKILELIIGGNLKKDSKEFLDYINLGYQSSSDMLELVNDILDLSKLQAGKFILNKEPFDIREIVDNRVSFYTLLANSRGISLFKFVDSSVPFDLNLDSRAISQVISNFISNSIKFTKSEGRIFINTFVVEPKSEILDTILENINKNNLVFPSKKDIKIKAKSLCVVVSDNGIGIPENSIKDLFKPYNQAKLAPVDKDSKSTGLGLVIAKGIVEAHNGSIGVVSRENIGTSFWFTIPIN